MCPTTGKVSYVTVQDAYKAMIAIDNSAFRTVKAKVASWHKGRSKPYRCADCGVWHIGHHAPRAAKPRTPEPGE